MDDPPAGGRLRRSRIPSTTPAATRRSRRWRRSLARPDAAGGARRPGRRGDRGQGLRPRARRRAHPRDRRRRDDGRGGADRGAGGPPARLRGARGRRAGRAPAAAARDRAARGADRRLRAEPQRRARARRPHVAADGGARAELRRAPAGVGADLRRDRRARRRGQVPALDRPDPRGRGGLPAGRGGPRRRAARTARAGSGRAPGLLLAAGRARDSDTGRLHLGRPRRARAPARAAELDQRLPAPPRPRAVGVGLREDGCPHAGAEGAVRGRVRHRQDDVGPGARCRARAGDVPRRPRHGRVEVHRRDREEPRPHLQRRRGLQRDPVLRRGRRAVRQALGDLGLARPLREHRGRLPAAEDGGLPGRGDPRNELPPQHRRRVRAPARLRDRLPVPRGRGPRAHLGAGAARHGADRARTSTSASSRRTSSCRAARSRTARCRPRSRPPTTAT